MKELIKALELRKKYNAMDFKEFIKELEEYKGIKISKRNIVFWQFTGLNNTDFFFYLDDILS